MSNTQVTVDDDGPALAGMGWVRWVALHPVATLMSNPGRIGLPPGEVNNAMALIHRGLVSLTDVGCGARVLHRPTPGARRLSRDSLQHHAGARPWDALTMSTVSLTPTRTAPAVPDPSGVRHTVRTTQLDAWRCTMNGERIWPRDGELEQGWFAVDEPAPGVFRIQEPLHNENVKSFLVPGTSRAALIDTGMGIGDIRAVVTSRTSLPVVVINSHAHWDHIGGNELFDEIWIHEAEADGLAGVSNEILRDWFGPHNMRGELPAHVDIETISYPSTPPTGILTGGEEIDLGDRSLEVLHCPGHSPGGIALWDERNRILFTTDVAYPCMLLVHDRADLETYHASLERLAAIEPRPEVVLGSHCDVEMPVAMLAAQRDALAAIIGGRDPDREVEEGRLLWEFDGFTVKLG